MHLAALDSQQQTAAKWAERRDNAGISLSVETGVYRRHDVALKAAGNNQCLIIDTRPFVDISALDIARRSDLVVIATGASLDDLEPSLLPGHKRVHKGISHSRLFYVVSYPLRRYRENIALQAGQDFIDVAFRPKFQATGVPLSGDKFKCAGFVNSGVIHLADLRRAGQIPDASSLRAASRFLRASASMTSG